MADLSKLSDSELMAIAAGQERARRSVQSMTDEELLAMAYQQPEPPPGATIHRGGGQSEVYRGKGKYEPTTMPEARSRALREAGINSVAGDVGDAALRGVPYFGAFMPRARAKMTSALNGTPYPEELAAEQARARTFDADYPGTSFGAKTAGAIGGTVAALPLMQGAGAGPAIARLALGGGSTGVGNAMLRGGAAGALQGAAQGYGESDDLASREALGNAASSGAFGLGFGAVMPAVVAGAGRAFDAVRNRGADALSSIPARARDWIVAQADAARLAQQRAAIADLGPEGMLADVSPEWRSVARGAAARPGSREAIIEALSGRDAAKNARIRSVVDTELGPAPTPSWQDARIRENQRALGPFYERSLEGQPPIDVNIGLRDRVDEALLHAKGEVKSTLQKVRDALMMENGQPDISARGVLGTRQALDLELEKNAQNPKVRQIIGGYREPVDTALKENVSRIGRLDRAYGEMANQREMLERGQTVFDSGRTAIRPEELQTTITNNRPASNRMLSAGARAEIDRIIGTNSNDVAKLNSLLKGEGDWNRDKLRLLFGQDRADRLLRVLDAERVMEGTQRAVVGNSETAATQGFKEFLDEAGKPKTLPPETTMTGLAIGAGRRAVQALTGGRAEDQAARFAEALGRLSVAQGGQRDAIIQALMTRNQRANTLATIYDAAGMAGPVSGPAAQTAAQEIVRLLRGDDGRGKARASR